MAAITLEAQVDPLDVAALRDGLAQFNAAHKAPPLTTLGVFLRDDNGQVKGGAYGDLGWNWLYIDLLWLDPSLRGQGLGEKIIHSIESGARARGIDRVYLTTTSFQALPFYYHLRYRLFGVLMDRPPGHRYYYLWRDCAHPSVDDLPAHDHPMPEDFNALRRGLRSHAQIRGVTTGAEPLTVLMRDAGVLVGGLTGLTYWGWFDLQTLWIAAGYRRRGYGRQMLALAEMEAARRGCPHIVADLPDFQNTAFFLDNGFAVFGQLPDRPNGHRTLFIQKSLTHNYSPIRTHGDRHR